MNLNHYFGKSARLFKFISILGIIISVFGALLPLFFIISQCIISVINVPLNLNDIYLILTDNRHVDALINSLIIAFTSSLVISIISIGLALISKWCELTGNKFIYTFCFIPLLIPDHVFGVAGRALIDPSIGLLKDFIPSSLLIERSSALLVIVLFMILKWAPIMFCAIDYSIFTIPRNILSQAEIDFKSFIKKTRFVFIPYIKEVLVLIICLVFILGFRQHELAVELTDSGGGLVAETWSVWNYKELFSFSLISNAVFEALLALVVLLIPVFIIKNKSHGIA